MRRRELARLLTRLERASTDESLQLLAATGTPEPPPVVAFTGPPGAGKSSLLAALARERLQRSAEHRIGVLAVDPSSPVGGGSLLGDRIRMEALGAHPRLYIRSVGSRGGSDGLAERTPEFLSAMAGHGFDELMLETVGSGQGDTGVRALADTLVLVLTPHSGDAIQAMKAGIAELADIYVVNKADLDGAARMRDDLESVLALSPREGWQPPVLLHRQHDPQDSARLSELLDRHRAQPGAASAARRRRERTRHWLRALLRRRAEEWLDQQPDARFEQAPLELARQLLDPAAPWPGEDGPGTA